MECERKRNYVSRGRTHDGIISFRLPENDKLNFKDRTRDNINPTGYVTGNVLRSFVKAYIDQPRQMDAIIDAYRRYGTF